MLQKTYHSFVIICLSHLSLRTKMLIVRLFKTKEFYRRSHMFFVKNFLRFYMKGNRSKLHTNGKITICVIRQKIDPF